MGLGQMLKKLGKPIPEIRALEDAPLADSEGYWIGGIYAVYGLTENGWVEFCRFKCLARAKSSARALSQTGMMKSRIVAYFADSVQEYEGGAIGAQWNDASEGWN